MILEKVKSLQTCKLKSSDKNKNRIVSKDRRNNQDKWNIQHGIKPSKRQNKTKKGHPSVVRDV
jgi:hypothetical protein